MSAKKRAVILWTALGIYLVMLVWLIVFKLRFVPLSLSHEYRPPANFIPFGAGLENPRLAVQEILLNVLAFVPLGLCLSALERPRRIWGRVLCGTILSTAFEAIQYAFNIGSADITDVITNTFGTLCGVLLFMGMRRLIKDKAAPAVGIAMLVGELFLIAMAVFT